MRKKEHCVKCKHTHKHTGHKRETIYINVEGRASKHRALSSVSTYYACRDNLADTGKESTSYGGCSARNEAYSKGIDNDRDTETLARVKQPIRISIFKCREHSSGTG